MLDYVTVITVTKLQYTKTNKHLQMAELPNPKRNCHLRWEKGDSLLGFNQDHFVYYVAIGWVLTTADAASTVFRTRGYKFPVEGDKCLPRPLQLRPSGQTHDSIS